MRIFEDANYEFLQKRRTAYMISGAVLLVFLVAAIFWQVRDGSWLDYGVDFTGGTLVQIEVAEETSVGELRSLLSGALPGTEITRFGEVNEFLIRAPQFDEEADAVAEGAAAEGEGNISDMIDELLAERFGAGGFTVVRTEAVGPKIGNELQQKAAIAILLSFALTLVYLAFRFEWRFGVAAVIATMHDILITLGLISFFRIEVSLTTVAAVLTIIGYSLNDTIVVFDRVRENLGKSGRREDYIDILNRSINETLPRTIMTSSTTLAALLALFVLGGPIIRDFALVLIIGILVGTYSSIFVASPALLEIENRTEGESRRRTPKPARARV